MHPLSEDQIQHYFREGYVVVENLVPRPVIAAVMDAAQPRLRQSDFWQPTTFEHADPQKDAALHRLLWEPAVYGAASQLLASPARVYYGMLAVVPAHGGRGLPWHQDNQYTHLLGGALNVFIALSHITADMAQLWVAPRSHLAGVRPAQRAAIHQGHMETLQAPENGLCLGELTPGSACIFDRSTLHRSLQNTTDRPRFAYAAQYQSDFAREAKTGKKDPLRMRAEDLTKLNGTQLPA
jgi:ectoine hydroxylase-related dioxygenase (phytanoyl-CoA dioxygenase family)